MENKTQSVQYYKKKDIAINQLYFSPMVLFVYN